MVCLRTFLRGTHWTDFDTNFTFRTQFCIDSYHILYHADGNRWTEINTSATSCTLFLVDSNHNFKYAVEKRLKISKAVFPHIIGHPRNQFPAHPAIGSPGQGPPGTNNPTIIFITKGNIP